MIDLLHGICLDVLRRLLNSTRGRKNDLLPDRMKVLNESTIRLLMAITPLRKHWADLQDPFHQGHGLHPHPNLTHITNNTPTHHRLINIIIHLCDLLNLLPWVCLVIHHHHMLVISGLFTVEIQRGNGLIRQKIRIGRKDLLSWGIPRINRIHRLIRLYHRRDGILGRFGGRDFGKLSFILSIVFIIFLHAMYLRLMIWHLAT